MKVRFKLRYILFWLISFPLTQSVNAQNYHRIDSIQQLLRNETADTGRVRCFNLLSREYRLSELDSCLAYGQKAVVLATKINYSKGLASGYNSIGIAHKNHGNYAKSIAFHLKALALREELNDIRGLAQSLNNIGVVYMYDEDYTMCLEYYLRALEKTRELIDDPAVGSVLGNIGIVYYYDENYEKALTYYQLAVTEDKRLNNTSGLSSTYNNIGVVFEQLELPDSALVYYERSMQIDVLEGNKKGIAGGLHNIGDVYLGKGEFDKALELFRESLQIATEGGFYADIKQAYFLIADANYLKKDYLKAYEAHQSYSAWKDSLINKDKVRLINEMEAKYENVKKGQEISLLKKEKELKSREEEAERRASRTRTIMLLVALGLACVLVIVIFRSLQQSKKSKRIILGQKQDLLFKNDLLEERNTSITDSIRYASRIQNAILPPLELVKSQLPNSFILYMPKDIVSGDFYWVDNLNEQSEQVLFAVVDCTGHGVPGAFMSIVGNNGLNRAVKEFGLRQPASIMDKLNVNVHETLRQDGDQTDINDGMDMALCSINYETSELQYAGANNPLWIVIRLNSLAERSDLKELANNQTVFEDFVLLEIKPDKQPIGKYAYRKPYENKVFKLFKDDAIYIFSDGYADQFGGERGKKYKYKQLKSTILEMQKYSMDVQRVRLEERIVAWRGELDQIDDVCMVGVKI